MRKTTTLFLQLIILLIFSASLCAEDIDLALELEAKGEQVNIHIRNNGKDKVTLDSAQIFLGNQTLRMVLGKSLGGGESLTVSETISVPTTRGTYALRVRIGYLNDGYRMSLLGAGLYWHGVEKTDPHSSCTIPKRSIHQRSELPVFHSGSYSPMLFLPEELVASQGTLFAGGTRFRLLNMRSNLESQHTIFAYAETLLPNGTVETVLCRGILSAPRIQKSQRFLPNWLLLSGFWTGIICSVVLFVALAKIQRDKAHYGMAAACRSSFYFALISLAILLFFNVHLISDWIQKSSWFLYLEASALPEIDLFWMYALLDWLYFDGNDFDAFARYFAPLLFFYFLFLNYFVVRYLKQDSIETDKYWHLMLYVFYCIPGLRVFVRRYLVSEEFSHSRRESAGQGARAFLVKLFFVPLLSSWTVQNLLHLSYLAGTTEFSLVGINTYLIALIILIDVAIFAFAYLFELPQLKNEIKSVDGTFFGWLVCLACYPPLNHLAFLFFDKPILSEVSLVSDALWIPATIFVTFFWLVYVSATIALGARASNLTNRGIVTRGPYAVVRHPAYAAKLCVWAITCFFLGELNILLFAILLFLYVLRAWTEERHLSKDPLYLEYKKRVRKAMIPGIW